MTRAVRLPIPCSARARAEVTPTWGARPLYGSIVEGKGSTARSVAVPDRPSKAARKNPTSATASSISPSLGTTYQTTPRGRFVAAAATKNALAAGVRPETTLAGKAIPLRAMAVFSSARNPRDVDVVTTDYSRPLVLNRTPGENTHR